MSEKLLRGRVVIPDMAAPAESGVIADGAVAVDGALVREAGAYTALAARYPHAEVIGSGRHLVIPGLVNAHHHGAGIPGFNLGSHDDYLEAWIPDPLRRRPLDTYLDTLYANMRLLRSGVTTVMHLAYASGRGPTAEVHATALRAYADSGLRVAYAPDCRDQSPVVYGDTALFLETLPPDLAEAMAARAGDKLMEEGFDYFRFMRDLSVAHQGSRKVRILFGPEGPEWCTPALLRKVRDAAADLDTGIHTHALESPIQRDHARQTQGSNTVARMQELGLLGPHTSIAHATWFDEDDMRRCADTGTTIVHNPGSNLRLRNGIAPVARMLELGVNVALGCDSTAINLDDDLFQEMRLATFLHRMPRRGPHAWCPSAADMLRLATANACRPTLFGDSIGALTPGRQADAVLLDLDAMAEPYLDPRMPLHDAVVHLASARHVDTVMVGGEVLLSGGAFTHLDEAKVRRDLAASLGDDGALFDLSARLKPYVERFYEARYPGFDATPFYTVNGG